MEPIKEYIGRIEYDSNFFGIVAALIAVLITFVIFIVFRRKHVSRNSVLITGLSDSGKTLLFARLVSTKKVATCTSMKENTALLNIPKKKSVTLVDVPGNERLRFKYIDEYLPSTRGIIFVIDSSNFQQCIRDVAEFLFMLLQMPLIHKYKIPVLIACNKQDHAVAKGSKVIKSLLEKELNAIRITQMGRLAETSESEEKVFLGSENRDFQFSDLKGILTEFIECSAVETTDTSDTDILKSVWSWLSKIS